MSARWSASDFALRHGRAVLFLAVAAAIAGLWVARSLPKGVYPELTFPREQVVATVSGASADTVLAAVTRRLEEQLVSIPGVEHLRSRTIRGAAEISLFFAPGTDMTQAHPLVLSRIAEIRGDLPSNTELTAERVLPSGFPILSLNVEGPYPAPRLYELAQYTLRPALSGLPGVGLVTVQSSDIPETHVLLDPTKLQAAHLTVQQVIQKLREANTVQAVARLESAHELTLGTVSGQFLSADDVGSVVVGGTPSAPLRVSDVAQVRSGTMPSRSIIRVDGRPGAIINVARRLGGDILTLDQAVRDTLATLKPSLPPGVEIRPVYEQAVFVDEAVRSVRDAVLFGGVLVIAVLALFLRDWRATVIASLSLPLTLGASLLALQALGQTLNLMTLGGLAVAVGLVIDDAVVVVEAVHKHLEAGLAPVEAARRGTDELLWPVIGTTITTVVVFLPLGLLTGVAGQFFIALSLALASAVVISLPIALLVLPTLAARFLKPLKHERKPSRLSARYDRMLRWSLLHRRWAIAGPVIAIVIGAIALTRVETGFLPEADEGAYVVDYFAPVGASLQEADAMASRVEQIIRDTPEVEDFSRRLGAELGPATATLTSRGDIAVRLKTDRERDIDEIMDQQRAKIAAALPGLRTEFIQVLSDVLGDLEGSPEPIEVKIYGPNPAVLLQLAADAAKRLEGAEGLVDVFAGNPGCTPERTLRVDPVSAARAGVTTADVADQLAGSYLGEVATQLRRPDHLEDIRVRLAGPEVLPVDALEQARVITPQGAPAIASGLGTISASCPAAELLRDNQRNMVHLTARLSGVGLGAAAKDVRERLKGLQLPTGYSWELGGLTLQQDESFRALVEALLVALVAITAVLLFQLRSARRTLGVLAATPVALAGGLLTLLVTGVPLNVSSMMGAILLLGLVVKNGILLMDHAIAAEDRGVSREEALREAGRDRLRPILMTTVATLVALIPLALGIGAGSALHRPLALVVLGGLSFSTFASLLLLPALTAGRSQREK